MIGSLMCECLGLLLQHLHDATQQCMGICECTCISFNKAPFIHIIWPVAAICCALGSMAGYHLYQLMLPRRWKANRQCIFRASTTAILRDLKAVGYR